MIFLVIIMHRKHIIADKNAVNFQKQDRQPIIKHRKGSLIGKMISDLFSV